MRSRNFPGSGRGDGRPSDPPPVRGQLEQHDHDQRDDDGEANEPHQKAHEKPSDLGKSRQAKEGRENDKKVKHLVHLPSVLY
jgi:chromatin remodeling complex protein RSC6